MPGDRGAAESARYALLGLLLSGPSHGYDLARQFTADSALGDVIHLSPSHLYALLGRLERDGMIAGEQQDAGNHPRRRVYHLTSTGEAAVQRWVDEPVGHPREMRIDFPLKLYIARGFGTERVAELIDRQRAVFQTYIAQLERDVKSTDTDDDADFLNLMRIGRIGRAQAALDWLRYCLGPVEIS